MEQLSRKNFLINTLYFSFIAILIYLFCRFLFSGLLPFVIAALVAYAAQKPSRYILARTGQKYKFIKGIFAVAVYIVFSAALIFLILKLGTAAIDFISDLSVYFKSLPKYFEGVKEKLQILNGDMPFLTDFLNSGVNTLSSKAAEFITSVAGGMAKNTPSFLIGLIVSAVSSYFIAVDFDGLLKFFRSIIGEKSYGNILKIKDITVNSVFKLIRGYLLLMLITFSELTVGFYLLGIKRAVLFAFFVALIDLLPVLGTGTVLLPFGIASLILGNTKTGFGILIIYAIVTVIRNFAEPKIISGQVGVNPLFILLSMFTGLRLLGGIGLILFPLALIVTVEYYRA